MLRTEIFICTLHLYEHDVGRGCKNPFITLAEIITGPEVGHTIPVVGGELFKVTGLRLTRPLVNGHVLIANTFDI